MPDKIIKIQIIHSLARNSAKNETFQKGVVDKAVDQKLVVAAYHEQAGNEPYHEAMLGRYLFSQIERLKTLFADYLTGEGNLAEDATIDSTETDGVTDILLSVSDRFNNGFVKTLARLAQKYVEDRMVYLWWLPVSKEFAALYEKAAEDDLQGIIRCFSKKAPQAPTYDFPTAITLRYPLLPPVPATVPAQTLFANPFIIAKGDSTEISYTLTGENGRMPIDDIIVRCDNACCKPCITSNGRWSLKAEKAGFTVVTLFSRHNDNVHASFAVRVTP